MIRKIYTVIALLFSTGQALAQDVEMADVFRQNGKIYVVVGVMVILLAGLFIYLFRIEKKVKKLEEK
jgi:hypothetical protein